MNSTIYVMLSVNGTPAGSVPVDIHGKWSASSIKLQRGVNLILATTNDTLSSSWSITNGLILPPPTVRGVSNGLLDPNSAPSQTPVDVTYTDIESGDQVSLRWYAGGVETIVGPQTAVANVPLVFNVPKGLVRPGRASASYDVTANGTHQASAHTEFTILDIDTWRDIYTDFSTASTLGIWLRGSAFTNARLVYSEGLRNDTTSRSGHKGTVIHSSLALQAGKSYKFSMTARNNGPDAWIQPELAIQINGQSIVSTSFTTSTWRTIQGTFNATASSTYTCSIYSNWDMGGGFGNTPEGGNDYSIRDIQIVRL